MKSSFFVFLKQMLKCLVELSPYLWGIEQNNLKKQENITPCYKKGHSDPNTMQWVNFQIRKTLNWPTEAQIH